MIGALCSFMGMAIGARYVLTEMPTFELLFFRSLVGLVVVGAVVARLGVASVRTQRLGLHVARNVAHFGGQYGWFFAIAVLPLTQVFAIEFTTPAWTLLLAALLLRERLTLPRLVAVAMGITGVLIILRPGHAPMNVGALAALLGAICFALSFIATKRLSATDPPLAVLFYMSLVQLPIGLVAALPGWVWPQSHHWGALLAVGLGALSAHYCMTRAFRLADAAVVVPIDFLRLPLSAVIGVLAYGEPLDPWVFVGAAIMVAGNLVNLRAERRR